MSGAQRRPSMAGCCRDLPLPSGYASRSSAPLLFAFAKSAHWGTFLPKGEGFGTRIGLAKAHFSHTCER